MALDINLILNDETYGTFKYAEVDDEGREVKTSDRQISRGVLYFIKSAFPNGRAPASIKLHVEYDEPAGAPRRKAPIAVSRAAAPARVVAARKTAAAAPVRGRRKRA